MCIGRIPGGLSLWSRPRGGRRNARYCGRRGVDGVNCEVAADARVFAGAVLEADDKRLALS